MPAEGLTRRLPAWTVAAPAIAKSTKVSVELPGITDEQRSIAPTGDEPLRLRGRTKSNEDGKTVVVDRRRRGKKRKSSEEEETRDAGGDVRSDAGEDVEFGRKPKGRIPRRRRNFKVDGRQVDVALLADDEIELTVEDLVSIAEENIAAYGDAPRPPGESTPECISARMEKPSSEVGVEEIDAGATNESSDTAQEMLDLLLGPLLKRKPLKEVPDHGE
ncbi:hypothetical protein MLD38_017957 [Melastoma candidum]|uniref:Uncharacterized protein n=1 Tax=Melastoma candidum TaxID=119954 RepID=A0ACB9QWE4_9MYRT|nr:hypothetical protein MLD38_017957 [Melastoma candidum]